MSVSFCISSQTEELNQKALVWSSFQVLSRLDSPSCLLSHSQTTASVLVGQHIVLSTYVEISKMWGISQSPGLDMHPRCILTVCGEMLLVCTSSPLYSHFPWGKTWAGGEPHVPSGNEWEQGVRGVVQSTPSGSVGAPWRLWPRWGWSAVALGGGRRYTALKVTEQGPAPGFPVTQPDRFSWPDQCSAVVPTGNST